MRILVVSKFRQFQGGVEKHVFDLIDGLEARGHVIDFMSSEDVTAAGGKVFDKHSHGLSGKFFSAQNLMWSSTARKVLRDRVASFSPDIVHYHSIYHQLSPSVLGATRTPAVMTLHDYKLAAPCYTLYRDGAVCTECVGSRLAVPNMEHRCIGSSRIASALCSAEHLTHFSRHVRHIDRFIVPSNYSRSIMTSAGVPDEQIDVVPWGVHTAPPVSEATSPNQERPYRLVSFVGRLHPTKGIRELLSAWAAFSPQMDVRLRIAGTGELREEVEEAAASDSRVEYLGHLDQAAVRDLIASSDVVAVPSLFPETMGLSALECLTAGTPILSSGRGALSDLSGAGVEEIPDLSAAAFAHSLELLFADGASKLDELRSGLAERDLSLYTQERMCMAIERVYDEVLRSSRRDVI